jgi:hypothetical protein
VLFIERFYMNNFQERKEMEEKRKRKRKKKKGMEII